MKKDKRTFSIVVFIVMIGLAVILLVKNNFQTTHVAKQEQNTENNSSQAVTYADISITESNDYATVMGVYPRFENAGDAFNNTISTFVQGITRDHLGIAEENWNTRIDTDSTQTVPSDADKFPLEMSYEVIQANTDFVSVLVRYGGYQGGAHGYENTVSFNYDIKNKKMMTLADLFPNDATYLETISSFSESNLIAMFKAKEGTERLDDFFVEMIETGTMAKVDNYKVFTFTDDVITLYFGEYQVAPYVYGPQKVVFSR